MARFFPSPFSNRRLARETRQRRRTLRRLLIESLDQRLPMAASLVADINSQTSGASSYPRDFTQVNGTIYFTADDGILGRELWKSDGTAAGTVMAKDIMSGSNSSNIRYLTNVSGTLYFTANDGANGNELWKSDGNVDRYGDDQRYSE